MKRILRMAGIARWQGQRLSGVSRFEKIHPGTAHQHCRTGYLPLTGYWAGHHRRHPGYGVRHQQPRWIHPHHIKLMQWTDDRQIHIHTILHQNKGMRTQEGTSVRNWTTRRKQSCWWKRTRGTATSAMFPPCTSGRWISSLCIPASTTEPCPNLRKVTKPEAKEAGKTLGGKVWPLQGYFRTAAPCRLETAFALKGIRLQGAGRHLNQDLSGRRVRLNHQNAVALYHHAAQQTDDSAGKTAGSIPSSPITTINRQSWKSLHFIPVSYIYDNLVKWFPENRKSLHFIPGAIYWEFSEVIVQTAYFKSCGQKEIIKALTKKRFPYEHRDCKTNQSGWLPAQPGLFTRQTAGYQPLVQISLREETELPSKWTPNATSGTTFDAPI